MNIVLRRQAVTAALAVSLLLSVATTSGQTAGLPPLIEQAFAAMEVTPSDQWAYRVITVTEDEKTVERFDPSLPASRWSLLEVDGQVPGKADLDAYEDELKTRDTPNLPDDFEFSELVDLKSLVLESEDDDQVRYGFNLSVKDEDDEAVAPFLAGTLIVNKTPAYVAAVELKNKDEFSPETGVKILDMRVSIAFEPLGENGPFFLRSVTEDVEARVFGFMKVAETEAIRVKDYVHVGQ